MSRFVVCVLATAALGVAPAMQEPVPALPKPLPVDDPKQAAVVLLDDHAERLIPFLTNDGDSTDANAPATAEEVDVYSGATALRVGGQQRFRAGLPGWTFPIREKPAAGEFRYLRFAWKKVGGGGIMVQMHDREKTWCVRYHAGPNAVGWESKPVVGVAPPGWVVVTRDLFEDFGPLTLTGMAFTPMNGTHGFFDHVLLGRSVADLDAKSDELLGKGKPKDALAGKVRDDTWTALGGRDAEKAGPAIRAFLATAPDQVAFVRERLTVGTPNIEGAKALRAKVAALVGKLGDDDFDTRSGAEAELEQLGDAAREEIVEAMNSPVPEVAYRARRLAGRLKLTARDTPMSAVRAARAVRILERAATPDAKRLLAEMSAGDFGPDNAAAAKAALTRK